MASALVATAVELYHKLDDGGKVIYRRIIGAPAEACSRTIESAFARYANKGGDMRILLEDMEADIV